MYIYVHVYVYMSVCVYIHMCVCVYIYIYIYTFLKVQSNKMSHTLSVRKPSLSFPTWVEHGKRQKKCERAVDSGSEVKVSKASSRPQPETQKRRGWEGKQVG